ncbi:MAG: MotA/TolQ/ExbB proton channel family protein [Phycisphaerales bacterium]|nr:MotA/TolQ/ExbB proton channel family protein [Phycisphaerales bacterium]
MIEHTIHVTTLCQTDSGSSLLSLIVAGGPIGFAIILLSVAAVALTVMHLVQIRQQNLAPMQIVEVLDELLRVRDVDGAIRYCRDETHNCFLTRVLAAGLARYQRSAFGVFELRAALEEAGQEQAAKLYRSTDGLGLIAGIAPLMGLLGTVVGMVGAFDTISSAEGFARPDQLAGDISQALITTVMGLILAIPALAAFTYFRNRIDALVVDAAATVEQLTLPLETHAATTSPRSTKPVPSADASDAS